MSLLKVGTNPLPFVKAGMKVFSPDYPGKIWVVQEVLGPDPRAAILENVSDGEELWEIVPVVKKRFALREPFQD